MKSMIVAPPFAPTAAERLNRARADLRIGLPVVVSGRWLAGAAETLDAARFAAMRAAGPVCLALTSWRAETLKARVYDGEVARLRAPSDAGLDWLRAAADPQTDLDTPMKGPFVAFRGEEGGAAPPFVAQTAIALAKTAHLLPAALLSPAPTTGLEGLTQLDAAETMRLIAAETVLNPVSAARAPLAAARNSRLRIFRPEDGGEEHYAVEVGAPDRAAPVLARLHSACFTGDVLGSLKCDCGPQLHAALEQMGEAGEGVLLYLNQEGRGIGLANKMRAYSLQDQGFDTVEANHRLGFEDDERDFRIGAALLRKMGFARVRLLTNNPRKVRMLESHGIEVVERVPLKVGKNPLNAAYLATKAAKSGHLL